jgi:hypothetical protein
MRGRGPPLRAIAYHEAGHAVMCWHEQIGIDVASIIPAPGSLGHVQHRSVLDGIDLACDNSLEGRARAESLIRIALAGSVAQRRIHPRGFRHYNSQADYETAANVLSHLAGPDDELAAYWHLLQIHTKTILNLEYVWERVQRIADALLEAKTLSSEELETLLEP